MLLIGLTLGAAWTNTFAPAILPEVVSKIVRRYFDGNALLDLEPQLRRIKNYEALPLLQQALHQYVEKGKKSAA